MPEPIELPLPSMLSQLLVAYTIEADTEFEHALPHRTALQGRGGGSGPWLTSLPMWANFLRYLPDEGATRAALQPLAALVNLAGLQRWGYVTATSSEHGDAADVLRPTRFGVAAQATWPRVLDTVEARWVDRFGAGLVGELQGALDAIAVRPLPDYLPVVGYGDGMRAHVPSVEALTAANRKVAPSTALAARLSRVLLGFTLDYEQRTRLSLTMLADVVRPIGDGIAVRDLPASGGVSKEGVTSAIGFLQRHQLAELTPDPDRARGKVVRLTPRGRSALTAHHHRLDEVELGWRAGFGDTAVQRLRRALTDLRTARGADGQPALAAGLTPYPECWRAQRPYLAQTRARCADPLGTLPHHPMVLHRGGYPDGS